MKILVDRKRCEGHGLCEDAAPDLFEIDDGGELVLLFDGTVPDGRDRQAADAVRICPVSALKAE
ncbi:ferredoxin [Amycolatopsis australiensis]|uniref:Ferredoxin n=1 Tax=Amycolatopsis australiensis TaxID=546364 RepID=A0A1K1S245_9PSEU|nr:ferredoxin [Amycolatopsis australiensis]SFW78382.1 ferredoxin [Amycolatopsis australiensis]